MICWPTRETLFHVEMQSLHFDNLPEFVNLCFEICSNKSVDLDMGLNGF